MHNEPVVCTDSAWTMANTLMEKQDTALITRCVAEAWEHLADSRVQSSCLVTYPRVPLITLSPPPGQCFRPFCDAQPNVRRRPVAFCRDLLNDPVACSVFRDQIAELPLCPGPPILTLTQSCSVEESFLVRRRRFL